MPQVLRVQRRMTRGLWTAVSRWLLAGNLVITLLGLGVVLAHSSSAHLAPITTLRPFVLAPNQRLLINSFNCGGKLAARATSAEVVLRYTPPDIAPGAGQCRSIPLAVRLSQALGARKVIDGLTHQPVAIVRWATPVQVCTANHLRDIGSGQFTTEAQLQRYVTPRLPPGYGGPYGPADAPAAWCWQAHPSGYCDSYVCHQRYCWQAIGIDALGYRFTSEALQDGRLPPQTSPA